MSNSLEFMDCENCGKRVRTTAERCHHCRHEIHGSDDQQMSEEDDFDYEQFLAEEFPDQATQRRASVKLWVWVTAWVLILATMLPFFYYFLN